MVSSAAVSVSGSSYRRHQPEQTVLYAIAAYGISWSNSGDSRRYDIDRIDVGEDDGRYELFIERRIGRALILKLSAERVFELGSRRTRLNYEPDRAPGSVDSRELRTEF